MDERLRKGAGLPRTNASARRPVVLRRSGATLSWAVGRGAQVDCHDDEVWEIDAALGVTLGEIDNGRQLHGLGGAGAHVTLSSCCRRESGPAAR